MEIRKIISEEVLKVFENESKEIKGLDILNHFPFSELPDTREQASWSKGVDSWGKVHIPSLKKKDAVEQIVSKEDFIYRESEGSKMTHKFPGYIDVFKNKFGEEPIFVIDPGAVWYDKVSIVNPKFLEWREDSYEVDIY